MNATQYAPLARRTLKELPREAHLCHMAMGLCGELGEFVDAIKKHVIYGKPLDNVNLTEEAGDTFWYTANLLTELGVSAEVLQRSIDEGFAQGAARRLTVELATFDLAADAIAANFAIAAIANHMCQEQDKLHPGSSGATQVIESLGGILGTLCGLFDLNPAAAMDLNIAKLAKRYGDKYSDQAALVRDLGAERAVLEGNVVQFPASAAPVGAAAVALLTESSRLVESQDAAVVPAPVPSPANLSGQEAEIDFFSDKPLGASCDLSGEGECEACQ